MVASITALLVCALAVSDRYVPAIIYVADTSTVLVGSDAVMAREHDEALSLQCDDRCVERCLLQSDSSCPAPAVTAPAAASASMAHDSVAGEPVLTSDERVVDPRRTPLSGSEAAKSLERAYRRQIGRRPSRETLALLTAHWAHETNQGASMFNYNFGGIKGIGPDGSYVLERTREGSGRSERRKIHRFRAYTNAIDGAVDYLSLLERLYGPALQAAELGDATGFVKALKAGGYFSADEEAYLQKVTRFIAAAQQWGFDAVGPAGIAPRHKATRDAALGR